MYKLYYLPGACSLATQAVMHEIGLPVEIINKKDAPEFSELNPVGTVPVLVDGDITLREGAAVMIHLLESSNSHLLPKSGPERLRALQSIMFANATMHPAYSRLFFIGSALDDGPVKDQALAAAAHSINSLWKVVNDQIGDKTFLDTDKVSAADIMLTVYSRWGAYFPVDIQLGSNTQRMIDAVLAMPSFQRALAAEEAQSKAA